MSKERNDDVVGAMCVARCGPDGKTEITEKYIVKIGGAKELVFMHEDRKKELKLKKKFVDYIKQFTKFEGKKITKTNIYKL